MTGLLQRAQTAEAVADEAKSLVEYLVEDEGNKYSITARGVLANMTQLGEAFRRDDTPDARLVGQIRKRHWEVPDYRGWYRRGSRMPKLSGRCACGSSFPCDVKRLLDLYDRMTEATNA